MSANSIVEGVLSDHTPHTASYWSAWLSSQKEASSKDDAQEYPLYIFLRDRSAHIAQRPTGKTPGAPGGQSTTGLEKKSYKPTESRVKEVVWLNN